MSYYLVRNELTKEFAIVESEIMQEIDELIDEHGCKKSTMVSLTTIKIGTCLLKKKLRKATDTSC